MKTLTTSLMAGVCSFALGAALAMPAQAQQAVDSQDAEEGDARLGVVTITAQRRAESLQDVPVTVTAFGAEEIKNARIQQIDDIVSRTPGLSFDAFPATQARLFIRGIGSSDRGAAGDPSSAVFLDEVYLGRPAMVAFDAFDLERIEVLKGPQGTLFGRNVVGGAINVITKRPDLEGFDAGTSLTYGNYNRLDGAGFVNLPFANGSSAVRVSGSYRSHDGYVENRFLNEDVEDQDTLSGRVQFYTEPTETMRVHLTLDGTRDRSSGPANHVLELDSSDPLSNFYSQNFDPDVTYGSRVGFQDRDTYGLRGEIANDFSFGTLTFLASYRDLDYGFNYDFDGGNPDPTSPGFNGVDISSDSPDVSGEQSELSSQELRLSSLPSSNIDWVVGLYRYAHEVDRLDVFTLDSALVAPIPLTEVFDQHAELDSYAVFGDVSVPVGDRWNIFGGLRYSKDEKSYTVGNLDSDAPLRADDIFEASASADFDDWTYRAGLEFQATPDDMLYASISRGYKSGGFQDQPATAAEAVIPFEPESAIQYEIGQKSTLFDGAMIWNNTLFYLDYTDLQTVQTINGINVTNNAGAATIKGYETQLAVSPADGLNLAVAYAYTDATFDEFVEGGVDYSGNRISRTPEHKLTISPSYVYTFANGVDLTLAADYRYASEIFDDNSNQPPEVRDPTHFVDARAILGNFGNGLEVSLWGKNLTDERTRTFQAVFLGANFGAFSPPRTYGVTLSWDY
ncbi:TonB-dependent receptor [Henriciella litoralis]|uniref:TonB-dependent receptor n=1 Tax=Henriciella litoralis TaxID=568102 RepID=UPI0009FCF8B9|nr:TonB-dependent receptor [Henriciella litoralis]